MKKMCVTDEAGFAAARAADNRTAEITEIDVTPNSILVYRFAPVDPANPYGTPVVHEMRELEALLERVCPGGMIVVLPGNDTLEKLPEAAMRQAGWVRAKPSA